MPTPVLLRARPNPKGIASSSPELRAARYSGKRVRVVGLPHGGCDLGLSARGPQPRWGRCGFSRSRPRVVRCSRPWALRRNPFGIRWGTIMVRAQEWAYGETTNIEHPTYSGPAKRMQNVECRMQHLRHRWRRKKKSDSGRKGTGAPKPQSRSKYSVVTFASR